MADASTSTDYSSSSIQLGNLGGCLLAAIAGDHLGRKNTLRVGAAISSIGAILQFSATTFPQFIVGRVINGFGNGLFIHFFKMLQNLTGSCRNDQFDMWYLPGRVLQGTTAREALCYRGSPQCSLLLSC